MSTIKYEGKSLLITNPDLVKEWDYEANSPLTPDNVSAGSALRIWWNCQRGHKWQAAVYSRTSGGTGCPYCAGKKILVGFNDLNTTHPNLSKEWDYEKNRSLTPENISFGSTKKVWWKCEMGHSWQASPNNRSRNRGCPYCSPSKTSMPEQGISFYLEKCCDVKRRCSIDGKEIDAYLPEFHIGIEYDGLRFHNSNKQLKLDSEKNLHFKNRGIVLIRVKEDTCNVIESDTLIRFKTDDMGKNYEWAVKSLFMIIYKMTGVMSFSSIDIDIKHDRSAIRERYNYTIKEDSLEKKYPNIAKQWNYEKNGMLTPDMFPKASNERVWWICELGHSWQEAISNRTNRDNCGCPYCSSHRLLIGFNDLQTKNPQLAAEWDFEKNSPVKPSDVLSSSSKKFWWKCKRGHSWESSLNNRSKNKGCPYCSNKKILEGYNDLKTLSPELAKEWDYKKNAPLSPTMIGVGSGKKIWWKCSNGHEWKVSVNDRYRDNLKCPYCSGRKSGPILCVETGVIYSGTQEASKITGIQAGSIASVCKGRQKTAGGFHWKYMNK